MSAAGAFRNAEMARAAVKLAVGANAAGLEAAARLVEERVAWWRDKVGRAGYGQRMAKTMVAELTMLVAGIRAFKTRPTEPAEES